MYLWFFLQSKIQKKKKLLQLVMVHISMTAPWGPFSRGGTKHPPSCNWYTTRSRCY